MERIKVNFTEENKDNTVTHYKGVIDHYIMNEYDKPCAIVLDERGQIHLIEIDELSHELFPKEELDL